MERARLLSVALHHLRNGKCCHRFPTTGTPGKPALVILSGGVTEIDSSTIFRIMSKNTLLLFSENVLRHHSKLSDAVLDSNQCLAP